MEHKDTTKAVKKTWDWEFKFNQTKNISKWEWVKSVQNNPTITEEQFVSFMTTHPRFGKYPSRNYCPSALKTKYRKLKEQFGFFQ